MICCRYSKVPSQTIVKTIFYKELTDVDTLTESEDGANALIEALLERQVVIPNAFKILIFPRLA